MMSRLAHIGVTLLCLVIMTCFWNVWGQTSGDTMVIVSPDAALNWATNLDCVHAPLLTREFLSVMLVCQCFLQYLSSNVGTLVEIFYGLLKGTAMAQLLSNFDFNQLAKKSGVTFDQFCPLRDALAESFACLDQEQKIKALKNLFAAYPNLPGKAEKQSSECPPSEMADCLIHDFYEHSEGNLKVQTSFMEGLATLMPHLLANMPAWDHRAPDAYAKYLGLRCYMMGDMNGRGLGCKGRWRRLDTGILMPFVGACFDAMDTCLENRILCDKGIKILIEDLTGLTADNHMELRKYLVARALDLHKKIGKWIEAEEGQDPAANADNPFIKRIREVQDYLDFSVHVAVYGYDEVRYRQADEQNATPEQLQLLKDLGVIKGERLAFVGGQAQIGGPSVPKKLPELSSGETSTLG